MSLGVVTRQGYRPRTTSQASAAAPRLVDLESEDFPADHRENLVTATVAGPALDRVGDHQAQGFARVVAARPLTAYGLRLTAYSQLKLKRKHRRTDGCATEPSTSASGWLVD